MAPRKTKFEIYQLASSKCNETDDVKIVILLYLLGDEAVHIYKTFESARIENKNKQETVSPKFQMDCNPLKNLDYEHTTFSFF